VVKDISDHGRKVRCRGKYYHNLSQKKTSPFYICDNLVRSHPMLPILGRNISCYVILSSLYHCDISTVGCIN